MNLSVIGLGRVGLTLSACLVSAGNDVNGVDVDRRLIDCLSQGAYDISEPGVGGRLRNRTAGRFLPTLDTERAIRQSDLTFVVVPTPSNEHAGFSLRHVLDACAAIGRALRSKAGDHTVAIVSTMLPGSSDARVIACLEESSGRRISEGLGYCYNPSFVAQGEIVKGIEEPAYVLIGESGSAAGDTVLRAHRTMIPEGTRVVRTNPVEAEITKIASNAQETMRVSFANMLFSICSEIPGADVDRITGALAPGAGHRIFKGAVPYGGPCWPRDNSALSAFCESIGVSAALPRAVDRLNAEHGRYLLEKVLSYAPAGETVAILGLSYKTGTPSIERSFGIDLAGWLLDEGRRVAAWDPLAIPEARACLGDRIEFLESLEACLRRSNVSVIVNPLHEFAAADWSAASHATVIDCWRCLPEAAASRIALYVPLGRGPQYDLASWLRGASFDQLTN